MGKIIASLVIFIAGIITLVITFTGATVIFIAKLPSLYLSNMRTTWRGMITGFPEPAREFIKSWDIHGLRHNYHYISENSTRIKVAMMPVEEQAEFADQMTVQFHPKKAGKRKPFPVPFPIIHSPLDLWGEINMSAINTTSIGNMAWLALYHSDEDTRNKCKSKLLEVKEYFSQFQNTQNYE